MNRVQNIPGWAPNGPYQFVCHVGYFPGFIAATAMMPFTKQALVADGEIIEEWSFDIPDDDNVYIESAEPFGFTGNPPALPSLST